MSDLDKCRTKLYAVQRELVTHVVWSRKDNDGGRAYECDLCEARDEDAGCAEDLRHKADCILSGCEPCLGDERHGRGL